MNTLHSNDDIPTRARRRVGIKLSFYTHALVYVLVNLGLFAFNSLAGGQRWSHYSLLGWGLGLTIHGLVTFINLQGQGVRERMLNNEIERLRQQ